MLPKTNPADSHFTESPVPIRARAQFAALLAHLIHEIPILQALGFDAHPAHRALLAQLINPTTIPAESPLNAAPSAPRTLSSTIPDPDPRGWQRPAENRFIEVTFS